MSAFRTISHRLLAYCLLAFPAISCQALESKNDQNSLVSFLEGAELQVETKDQVLEIMRALEDMLTLPPEELRKVRYSDYQMNEGRWTLPRLLSAYFLPPKPMSLDPDSFYLDTATDACRIAVKKKLNQLKALDFR